MVNDFYKNPKISFVYLFYRYPDYLFIFQSLFCQDGYKRNRNVFDASLIKKASRAKLEHKLNAMNQSISLE